MTDMSGTFYKLLGGTHPFLKHMPDPKNASFVFDIRLTKDCHICLAGEGGNEA